MNKSQSMIDFFKKMAKFRECDLYSANTVSEEYLVCGARRQVLMLVNWSSCVSLGVEC